MRILDDIEKAIENSKRITSNIDNLHSLREMANTCKGCELHLGRSNVVFSKGNQNSNIMIVGMAPAKEEDKEGVPFIGKSGKFLDKMLEDSGITTDGVYITNSVKCYLKPGLPIKKKCAEACGFYLKKQIEIIKPEYIIALGRYSTVSLYRLLGLETNTFKLADVQGTCREFNGIKVYSTYHPQYLARFGGKGTKYYRRAIKVFKEVKSLINQ